MLSRHVHITERQEEISSNREQCDRENIDQLPDHSRPCSITPLTDPNELDRLIRQNAPALIFGDGGSAANWLSRPNTFALCSGDDLGLFEAGPEWPGPLTAHVLFASRGKQALRTAKAMLAIAFSYGATSILGETPVDLPHALLFARMLGFRPHGEAERPMGRVILSELNANLPTG